LLVAGATAAPLLLAAVLLRVAGVADQTNVAFAFLLMVVAAAAYGGGAPGVAAALAAFLTFNFFFIEPVRTLSVSTRRDFGVLLGFLVVSLVVSSLVARAEAHREQAERAAEDAELLFDLSVSLTDETEPGNEMAAVAELAERRLGFRAVAVVLAGATNEVLHAAGVPGQLLRLALAGGAGDAVVASAPLRRGGRLVLVAYAHGRVEERRRELLVAFAARAAAAAERRASQEERERMAVLQETDRQRSALLSSVSHDLRTPLAGIKASAAAYPTASSEDERESLAASIMSEVDRLDRMVRNLLDLSRVEGGIITATLEVVPVEELVGTVLSRLRPAIGSREMRVDVPADVPAVLIDFVQVEQALTNLVENAVQHSPPTAALLISACANDHEVTVRVADTGPGIAPDERDRIFRRFERGRQARPGGSGLGLAIARAFAVASGGRVELATVESGTAFDLVLRIPPGAR
jgi:two-component system sensor histidine kinase KdpD